MKLLVMFFLLIGLSSQVMGATSCTPTMPDSRGPFYEPDAPVRSVLGVGYVLEGHVRSSVDCSSIPDARIEVWHAGSDGKYSDSYRATIISDINGHYQLQTIKPPRYSSFRPPHIHIQVTAPGYTTLVTQHYPEEGASEALFDLVLVPVKGGGE